MNFKTNNIEAEISILSEIMTVPNKIYEAIRSGLNTGHFGDNFTGCVYGVMVDIHNRGEEVTPITIRTEAEKKGVIIELSTLTDMITKHINTGTIQSNIKLILEAYARRTILESIKDLADNIEKMELSEIKSNLELLSVYAKCSERYKDLTHSVDNIRKHNSNLRVYTGFDCIDVNTHGLRGGTLTIITGDSGAGKSTIINQITANIMSSGTCVFLYSGELSNYDVTTWLYRAIANESDLEIQELKDGIKTYNVSKRGLFLIENWTKSKLRIYGDEYTGKIDDILNAIEHTYSKHNTKVFVIDNLMTVTAEGRDIFEKQRYIVNSLKDISKRLDIVILLVAHHKKGTDKGASMYDISGASEIVNLADHIISLKRGNADNETLLNITKNRTTGKLLKDGAITFSTKRKRYYEYFEEELNKDYGYSEVGKQLGMVQDE